MNKNNTSSSFNFAFFSPKWQYTTLFLLCILLYFNTFTHEYSFDDKYNTPLNERVSKGWGAAWDILTQPYMEAEGGLGRSGGYRPITMLTYLLEYQCFGENPNISHIISTLLYGLACVLLLMVLRQIFYQQIGLFPFLCVLLFAVHPIHTEVVASLKNREELLAFLFGILTILLFLKYFSQKNAQSKHKSSNTFYFILGIFTYLLAIFSKSGAIVFALIIPLCLFFAATTIARSWQKTVGLSVFLLVIGIGSLGLITLSFESDLNATMNYTENFLVAESNIFNRLAAVFSIVGHYFKMAVAPFPMRFYYGTGQLNPVTFANISVLLSAILHIGLLLIGLKYLRQKHLAAFAIFYYLFGISVYSNLLAGLAGIVGDRHLFNGVLGICILGIFLIFKILKINILNTSKNSNIDRKKGILLAIILLIIILPASFGTIKRNADWKNTYTLVTHDIPYLQKSPVANYLTANVLLVEAEKKDLKSEQKQLAKKAIKYYQQSIKLYPALSDNYRNLAYIYCRILEEPLKAIPFIEKAIALSPNNYKNLKEAADCYSKLGDNENAQKYYQKYAAIQGDDIGTKVKLVTQLSISKNFEEAKKVLKNLTEIAPNTEQTFMAHGTFYLAQSDTATANQYFEKVVEINPKASQLALMVAAYYHKKGDAKKAQYYLQISQQGNQ